MNKISPGTLIPSAAFSVGKKLMKHYVLKDKLPEVGDLIYGNIERMGEHEELENRSGRIHRIHNGTKAVFVFANRYAPDAYEAIIPKQMTMYVDLLARSGVVGTVICKNCLVKDPTIVRMLGYVCDSKGEVVNTTDHCLINPTTQEKKANRAKMILIVGTSMNSGKSVTAAGAVWALSSSGHTVRGSKLTGTASLKDILHMQDSGASIVNDFTHFGYPSTYLLSLDELLNIFNKLDLKYANNPRNYWVVEIADGILQRETKMLLQSEAVKSRIHRLIFTACDAFSAIGGLSILNSEFNLKPHAISGVCSSSPLALRELKDYTDIPVLNNRMWNLEQLSQALL